MPARPSDVCASLQGGESVEHGPGLDAVVEALLALAPVDDPLLESPLSADQLRERLEPARIRPYDVPAGLHLDADQRSSARST